MCKQNAIGCGTIWYMHGKDAAKAYLAHFGQVQLDLEHAD